MLITFTYLRRIVDVSQSYLDHIQINYLVLPINYSTQYFSNLFISLNLKLIIILIINTVTNLEVVNIEIYNMGNINDIDAVCSVVYLFFSEIMLSCLAGFLYCF